MIKQLIVLLLLCGAAKAQSFYSFAPQKYPNAVFYVCGVPANGSPCSNQVNVYSTQSLGSPLVQPMIAGPDGNFGFWVSPAQSQITIEIQPPSAYATTYVVSLPGSQPPGSGGAIPGVIDPVRKVVLYADGVVGVTAAFQGNAPVVLGQGGGDGMTATQPQGRFYSTGAGASTNITGGFEQGFGGNLGQGAYTFGTVSRVALSIRTANTTNVRYWIGQTDGKVSTFNGSDATFATDTPNLSYCMFRFSAGTDTTWKAVCGTSNVAQTVVDTGIAPTTTNATLFEIQNPNYGAMTSMVFSINGSTVATITTNLPAASLQFGQMWSIDNKNTANNVGGGFFWGELFFYK